MQIEMNGRLSGMNQTGAANRESRQQSATVCWIQTLAEEAKKQESGSVRDDNSVTAKTRGTGERSEAAAIYEAAAGGENPIKSIRQAEKVPYGYLAEDGVINYNGVCFVCDEKTNSICLGDMSNPKNVITVALSGGGHLKVNRDNLGDLSRAVGMFSPEDLNLIMRAIAQDTKIQSMKQEIEDMEGSVGNEMAAESRAVEENAEKGSEQEE